MYYYVVFYSDNLYVNKSRKYTKDIYPRIYVYKELSYKLISGDMWLWPMRT